MGRRRERGFPPDPEPLPLAVVDNHTHLDAIAEVVGDGDGARDGTLGSDGGEAGPPSIAAHLARAAAVGVDRVVQVGCDLPSARWTAELVAQDAGPGADPGPAPGQVQAAVLGAVAIHPNEATLHGGVAEVGPDGLTPQPQDRHEVSLDDAIAEIASLARGEGRIRAIGETGMDLFRTGPEGAAVQRESFRAHIALAKELGLALQIHDRDAHAEVVEVLLADGAPERTVFHCFSGDAELASLAAEHGWYCSFAGPVTYPKNDDLRAALRLLPPELVLAETDAPYLPPHPYRGRPNAPYVVAHTVRAMAEITGRDLPAVCAAVSAASEQVYGPW